jgi:protein-tyrosine phosphatase
VLVHCRGGLGRAGVVAGAWLAALGLLGAGNAPRETVERALGVLRRRRSAKSVESAEQVAALLAFAELLHTEGWEGEAQEEMAEAEG